MVDRIERLGGSGGEPPNRAGGGSAVPQKRRAGGGSTQTVLYGVADVKVYPINEYQLSLLGQNRGWAGACFALAGILFGFFMNVWVSIELSAGVSDVILARWQAVRLSCLIASIILVVAGLVFLGFGYGVISSIKKRTSFD
jgi:hypothetical protein